MVRISRKKTMVLKTFVRSLTSNLLHTSTILFLCLADHTLQDPISNFGEDLETTSCYLLLCLDYLHESKTHLNTVIYIISSIFYFNNDQLTQILLYGKEDLDNNTSILDATINYLIETKIFNAELFFILSGCHSFKIDVAFKIQIFVLFFLFLFSLFLSFYYFSVVFFKYFICIFFVPRYITIDR